MFSDKLLAIVGLVVAPAFADPQEGYAYGGMNPSGMPSGLPSAIMPITVTDSVTVTKPITVTLTQTITLSRPDCGSTSTIDGTTHVTSTNRVLVTVSVSTLSELTASSVEATGVPNAGTTSVSSTVTSLPSTSTPFPGGGNSTSPCETGTSISEVGGVTGAGTALTSTLTFFTTPTQGTVKGTSAIVATHTTSSWSPMVSAMGSQDMVNYRLLAGAFGVASLVFTLGF
ncbi:hypothetical protein F5Y19DRAFT_438164 [Xylariaceae sp. FL1651]|nr:hypothetical protein F5Y19DRAFT_438164 [Xylariaceae sp. FL1651]